MAKIPSPKAMGFLRITVKVLNSYAMFKNSSMARLMYFPFFQ